MLISDDLPTLLRPMKANSGNPSSGICEILPLLNAKPADVIFIIPWCFPQR